MSTRVAKAEKFTVVFYGRKFQFLTIKEKLHLRVTATRVLRKISTLKTGKSNIGVDKTAE